MRVIILKEGGILHCDKIKQIISSVNWTQYETAYGNAAENIHYYVQTGDNRGYIPKVNQSLEDLFSDDKNVALQASHDLWCGLCHQHTYVYSAALPAYDILFLGLPNLDDELKVEILDIFMGFVVCISKNNSSDSWQGQLKSKLERDRAFFQMLISNKNEDISAFAENIVSEL